MWAVCVLSLLAVVAAAYSNLPLLLLLLLLLLGVVLCSERPPCPGGVMALEEEATEAAKGDMVDSSGEGAAAPVRLALHSTENDHPADLNVPHYENQMQRNLVNAPLPSAQHRQQFTAFLADGHCSQKDKWMVVDERRNDGEEIKR